jgi:hypothetical protein
VDIHADILRLSQHPKLQSHLLAGSEVPRKFAVQEKLSRGLFDLIVCVLRPRSFPVADLQRSRRFEDQVNFTEQIWQAWNKLASQ